MKSLVVENEMLREQVRQLKQALTGDLRWPIEWRLTRVETIVLGVLMTRARPGHAAFWCALYADSEDPPDAKVLDVHVCKLRRKLKPLGILIRTEWGMGWHLPAADRARLRKIAAQVRQQQ